jgi:alginate O-acetyltransferase complex protein AlgI
VVAMKIILTFNLVCVAYVLFRAESLHAAGYMLSHLFEGWSSAGATLLSAFADGGVTLALATGGAGLVLVVEALPPERAHALGSRAFIRWICIGLCASAVIFAALTYGADRPFIYSRF